MWSNLQLIAFNRAAIEQVRRSLIAYPISLAMRLECFTFERFHYVGLTQYENSGRKNVLRKLLRIPYRRLKAGFFCVLTLFDCVCPWESSD